MRKPSQGETSPRERSEKEWERAVVYSVSRGDGDRPGDRRKEGSMVTTLVGNSGRRNSGLAEP